VSRSSASRTPPRLLMLLLSVVGVLTAGLGISVVREETTTPQGWVVVEGSVIDHVVSLSSKGGTAYAAVVEFRAPDGSIREVVSSVAGPTMDGIGTPMQVAYNPANPGEARVVGGLADIIWIAVTAFGLLLVGFANLALGGRGGAAGRAPGDGSDRRHPATGRIAFHTPGGRLQVVLPIAGGAAFVGASQAGFMPDGLGSLMFMLLGVLVIALGILGLVRGNHPVIEVGASGVWLPGVGARAWGEFSDVRLETFSVGGRQPRVYRRLGFVPRDPAIVASQPVTERISAWIRLLQYRVALSGSTPMAFAPLGVAESDLGNGLFDELLEAVAAEVPLGSWGRVPA
jgi:hypothetical protein